MLNIKQFLDMSGRAARRLLEFVALLFVVAAIGFLVQFFERLLPENVVSLPAPWGPMIRVRSSLCLQTLAALWLLATLQRGYPLRTLFRIPLRTTAGVVAAAVASITLAALLIDFPAIRSNGFHPINPSIHPEVWTATLAAMTLGASHWTVFRRITAPMILPGITGGWLLAFINSFDELTMSIFVTSPQPVTLPVRMYMYATESIDPMMAAVSALMIALTAGAMLVIDRAFGLDKILVGEK